ncbi:MAG: hypothetical protein K6T86_09820 [Pirellulales bacterium]|nr:hypothetical protein [Pirellulales bacterium]
MNQQRLPRREFGRCLVGGVAFALPLQATAALQEGVAGSQPPPDASPAAEGQGARDGALRQGEPRSPEEHYLALVQLLYPDERLGEAELQAVRGQIQAMLARGRALSEFPLSNADEPAVSFAAYRAAE